VLTLVSRTSEWGAKIASILRVSAVLRPKPSPDGLNSYEE